MTVIIKSPNYENASPSRRGLAPALATQVLATCRPYWNGRSEEQLSVLDVGCDYGDTTLELAKRCDRVTTRHCIAALFSVVVGHLEAVCDCREEGRMTSARISAGPCVSVLMTVFNPDPVLFRQAVDSVLRQTFEDFEFVIVEDPSPRLARDMLSAAQMARIRYFLNPQRTSLVEQRNLGIRECKGKIAERCLPLLPERAVYRLTLTMLYHTGQPLTTPNASGNFWKSDLVSATI